MTIIVYRNKVIASDTLITCCNTVWSSGKKITKAKDGTLAGASGDMSFVQEFLEWVMMDDRQDYDPPKSNACNNALLITKKTILFYAGKKPIPIRCEYVAIGSGQNIAIGALWMGASAQQAAHAAITHSVNCGGEVDFLEM